MKNTDNIRRVANSRKLMEKPMRILSATLLAGTVLLSSGCQDFLDVNDNPNAPETVSAFLYLPQMLHWMATSPQYDGRLLGRYLQMWTRPHTSGDPYTWERMGYDAGSDNGAEQWRLVYWNMGQNLVDMMTKAEAEQRWDVLGVGYAMKAWGWMVLTDMHGEVIIKEAFNPATFNFGYDTQEFAYQEVFRLLDKAIENLQRSDGAVDQSYLARGDKIYNGDRGQWLKFAYGLKALALNHFTNKASYKPADVIAAVDKSFTSNADDALGSFPGTSPDNADKNFYGRTRGNVTGTTMGGGYQTVFAVEMMDGTQFGGVVDPRLTRILVPAADGVYRGINPMQGFISVPTAQRPYNLHGYAGAGGAGGMGRYLFDDKVRAPIMTYSQLQFVKAEAALKMGNNAQARDAYLKAVDAHLDFVNARNAELGGTPVTGYIPATPITAAEKAAFLASPEIAPATITLSHIMSQKWIAQYGWGFNEAWLDMRRYHYTDVDPVSGKQVFRGFQIPTNLHPDNANKTVQRMRPRYNSEYVWNRAGLEAIGGLAVDYHTVPLWIIQP